MSWTCDSPRCGVERGELKPCPHLRSCSEGMFRREVAALGGKWSVRPAAAYGCGTPWTARRKIAGGAVEVWGGAHRREVWAVAADGTETMVGLWTHATLPALAGEAESLLCGPTLFGAAS